MTDDPRDIVARAKPQMTLVVEVTLVGPIEALFTTTGEDVAQSTLDGFGFPFGVEATGLIVRRTK